MQRLPSPNDDVRRLQSRGKQKLIQSTHHVDAGHMVGSAVIRERRHQGKPKWKTKDDTGVVAELHDGAGSSHPSGMLRLMEVDPRLDGPPQ